MGVLSHVVLWKERQVVTDLVHCTSYLNSSVLPSFFGKNWWQIMQWGTPQIALHLHLQDAQSLHGSYRSLEQLSLPECHLDVVSPQTMLCVRFLSTHHFTCNKLCESIGPPTHIHTEWLPEKISELLICQTKPHFTLLPYILSKYLFLFARTLLPQFGITFNGLTKAPRDHVTTQKSHHVFHGHWLIHSLRACLSHRQR